MIVGVGVGVSVGISLSVGVEVFEGVMFGVGVFEGVTLGVGVGVVQILYAPSIIVTEQIVAPLKSINGACGQLNNPFALPDSTVTNRFIKLF